MRLTNLAISLLAACCLSACSSTQGVDVLQLQNPSSEITGSVMRPSAPVASTATADAPQAAEVAEDVAAAIEAAAEPIALAAAPQPSRAPMPGRKPAGDRAARGKAVTQKIYGYGFKDAKPIDFGKRSPRKLAVHGVDVSRWQGDIDWQKLRRNGANFVYIKATDGGDHLDPMFSRNWRAADLAGLRRGAYHFFYWCRTAGEQADWFIRNVPKVAGALPPVIDVEWNGESRCRRRPSREKVLEKMQVFMDKLERHYGQRPVIYTAPDFYDDNLKGAFKDYPFWLRSVAAHPSKRYPGRDWVFWQYSGSGLSHGVDGRIDLNVFHGDQRDWQRWLGQVTTTPMMASAD
jgi:lysozyme